MKLVLLALENKPGALDQALRVIRERNIDLCFTGASAFNGLGVVHFLPKKQAALDETLDALQETGWFIGTVDVLAIPVEDAPGKLQELTGIIAKEGINIEYCYAFSLKMETLVLLRIADFDIDRAKNLVESKGYIALEELA